MRREPFRNELRNPVGFDCSNTSEVILRGVDQLLPVKDPATKKKGYGVHNGFRVWLLLEQHGGGMNGCRLVAHHRSVLATRVLHHLAHLLRNLDEHPHRKALPHLVQLALTALTSQSRADPTTSSMSSFLQ